MTRCTFCSKSFGPTIARLLLLIGVVLVVVTPRAASAATYLDIISENVDYLNNPLEDMQLEPCCNLMMSGEIDADTVAAFKEAVSIGLASQVSNGIGSRTLREGTHHDEAVASSVRSRACWRIQIFLGRAYGRLAADLPVAT